MPATDLHLVSIEFCELNAAVGTCDGIMQFKECGAFISSSFILCLVASAGVITPQGFLVLGVVWVVQGQVTHQVATVCKLLVTVRTLVALNTYTDMDLIQASICKKKRNAMVDVPAKFILQRPNSWWGGHATISGSLS